MGRSVLLLDAGREQEGCARDGPSGRRPGLRGWRGRRQLGLAGAGPWTWGGTLGLSFGENLEDQLTKQTQKYRKGEALRPRPGAPLQGHCGNWQRFPIPRRMQHRERPPPNTQGGHHPQAPHSGPKRVAPQVPAGANPDLRSVRSLWESEESPLAVPRVWEPLGQRPCPAHEVSALLSPAPALSRRPLPWKPPTLRRSTNLKIWTLMAQEDRLALNKCTF